MKKLWKTFDISLISYISAVAFFAFIIFDNRNVGIIGLSFSTLLFSLKIAYTILKRNKLISKIKTVSDELDFAQGKAFEKLTVPCAAIEQDGKIIWINDSFRESFSVKENSSNMRLKSSFEILTYLSLT